MDKKGNFCVAGAEKQGIYVYDPTGKVLRVIGDKIKPLTVADGSEPAPFVAVDSAGNIYSYTTAANPLLVTEYTADGKTVYLRPGTFHGADAWQNLLLAVAPDDRIWVSDTRPSDPLAPLASQHHFRPVVMRLESGFLNPKKLGVKQGDALKLGFWPYLTTDLLNHVTNDLAPINATFNLTPWNPNVKEVTVDWTAYDYRKNDVGHGTVKLPCPYVQPIAVQSFPITFTPTKYGWYTVEAQVSADGNHLGGASIMFGVTPKYDDMTVQPSEFLHGMVDVPRQMYSGLPFVRLAAGPTNLPQLEDQVAMCQKYGATMNVQFNFEKADFTPDKIRPVIEQFKGRVPRWELFNEPNFFFSPEEFATAAKPVYDMIKQVDPNAQVVGPSVCGITLSWYEAFLKAGGGKACDIISLHDYEGNETIDPDHWRYKFAQLRALMAKYDDGNKEIYQTERASTGVRTHLLIGLQQAERVTLHNDLLETLGVPTDHDSHYYLNESGYNAVPSYIWTRSSNPLPAALAMRTREALIKGKKYAGSVDFGPSGRNIFMAVRFEGGDAPVISVRNLARWIRRWMSR